MDQSRKIAVPKPASSIMVIRDGQGGLEVLMIERAKTMKFAPGAFVFPGGKVDKADMQGWRWQGITTGRSAMRDFAYRVAALRELYEEAGILLTDRAPKRTLTPAVPFATMVRNAGVRLDISNMVPFAHWVTPEPMPRRFDTYFYLAPHNGELAVHDGNEAISFRWVSPRRILDDWENDRIPLMFPTRLNLMKLARAATVNEAMRQARRAKVIRTLPVVHMQEGGVSLSIDPATGFGVTAATPKELSVEAAGLAKKA